VVEQQVVSYPKREFNSTRSSSVQGLVGNYDITDNDLRSTFPNVENLADVEYLYLSVLTIAAGDDIIRKPKVSCISGNCTFPQYTTLGVCSQCHDTTDDINLDSIDRTTNCHAYYNEHGIDFMDANISSSHAQTLQSVNTANRVPFSKPGNLHVVNVETFGVAACLFCLLMYFHVVHHGTKFGSPRI
jgi:hypothetical protein